MIDSSKLSKSDVLKLKGIGIFLIVLHNYFHLIFLKTKENEIDFDPSRFLYFFDGFYTRPQEWIPAFFTYFGHFGVQLFIFLSAYGLTRAHKSGGLVFLKSRLIKLYPSFLLAILFYAVYQAVEQADVRIIYWDILGNLQQYVQLLSGLYPFVPGHGYPVVGPWWFIAFIIQFYIVWSLLSRHILGLTKHTGAGLFVLSILLNYTLVPFVLRQFDINLMLTVFGHLPEILLGIMFANYAFKISPAVLFAAFTVFLLSGLYIEFWSLHHISALIILLWAFQRERVLREDNKPGQFIQWLGVYSLPLFLVNGFLRGPFIAASKTFNTLWVDTFIALVFLMWSMLIAVVFQRVLDKTSSVSARLYQKVF